MYVARQAKESEISFTSDVNAARNWGSYQQAYSYMDEYLYGMVDVVKVNPPVPNQAKSISSGLLIGLAIAAVIGGATVAIRQLTNPCVSEKILGSCYGESQAKPLVIGVVSPSQKEDYSALAAYLQTKLGRSVKIDKDTPFEDIPDRINHKNWDIAFTRSPIFSIDAESNYYLGVARMFPEEPPYYRAVLYVRFDSTIQTIDDINAETTIALGNRDSAPTFYLPIYALYGKSLRVGIGYRPSDVVELVKAGKVDIGAGRYDAVKDDPNLKIIYISKAIPGAGVYLSPLLGSEQKIKEVILNAPPEIQAKADYGNGQIPNYTELKKIIAKTNNFLNCPGIELKSLNLEKTVNLFCQRSQRR